MFFSRITVREGARNSNNLRGAFRSAYSLHQAIWRLFDDHRDRKRDFLYHLEEGPKLPVVYALSARQPELASEVWQVAVREFGPKLRIGMRLGFSLRANPVVTRKPETPDQNPTKRKRHDVVMEAKHILKTQGLFAERWPAEGILVQESGEKWLRDRSEKNGFQVIDVRADGYRQHQFFKSGGHEPVRLSTVDFTGLLEVLDPARFAEKLHEGFGPAKGFGCGLMLIRRL